MSFLGDLAVVERGEQFKLTQLHLRELGLKHVPAVPVDLAAPQTPRSRSSAQAGSVPDLAVAHNIET